LGAHRVDGGTNFSVWSRTQAELDLLLFDDVDDARPSCVIPLDRLRNRTAYYWHLFVPDVGPGQVYAWRVHESSAILLDPYGVAVAVPMAYDRMAGAHPDRDPGTAMKSVVADLSAHDWEGDVRSGALLRALSSTSFTSGASPLIPTAGWPLSWPAPTPGWWPRFPTCARWESLRWN
jgi:isoamylase